MYIGQCVRNVPVPRDSGTTGHMSITHRPDPDHPSTLQAPIRPVVVILHLGGPPGTISGTI